jgi:hypothetical protein
MDGVYDQNGQLNQAHTDFLISNDYVLKTVQAHSNEFLAGVSINAQRQDAVEEIHRCADASPTLVKVRPTPSNSIRLTRVTKPSIVHWPYGSYRSSVTSATSSA